MTTCPVCGGEIQADTVICWHCGVDVTDRTARRARGIHWPRWRSIGVAALAVGVVWASYVVTTQKPRLDAPPPAASPTPASAVPAADLAAEIRLDKMVEASLRDGGIKRISVAGHEVLINPLVWAAIDADEKRGLTKAAATYCDQHGTRSGVLFVDVIDSQSGKKLAHYGPTGFEVF
jgi:predicted nucleic acid-binding Zn ribbon protein